ncbi:MULTISPECIES: ribosome hibernation-promoting factor, HPF/YfiA family [Acetobacter]|uniref:Ribosome hibernation promoting factor n=1 Tax=Acetobacter sacchari TaxID=2661687 RepID=A0ABS3M080_9PROT|nr:MULTISPECIES: ribosome-associated translation inhibitor RaiA [Acetobacter]MBO1361559.1 ribosome-associated translation inhibitor RaiA [Acetobacter sacchari]OUJ13125.1 30S ribosomal protein S30 [Acetobacter sp. DsW_063]
MNIHVAGKQLDLSDALKQRVTSHLGGIADRYFDQALEADVTFSRARSFFTCDINVHAGRGLTLRGEGEASDAHGAFDDAAEHIARRLRRYRRRVQTHSRASARHPGPEVGRTYVLRQTEPSATSLQTADESDGPYATIIAEQPTEIALLSVSEAVMRLDLADRNLLVFRNSVSRQINIVYRRDDGNIGWVDPTPT